MHQFSPDTLSLNLSKRNLSIKDDDFYNNLNDTQKSLIIGENGAGKTRLLQAIEEFYKAEINKNNKQNIILIPMYCTDLDISDPFIKDTIGNKPPINDEVDGIVYQAIPQKNILEMNKETLGFLFEQIRIGPKTQMNEILARINKDLKKFLPKTLTLDTNKKGKQELMISRREDNTLKPLTEEWALLSPGERIILFLFLLIHYLEQMKDSIDNKNVVILIDEPEQHLHPKVMLDIISERLFKYFSSNMDKPEIKSNWRLFISSHSVFLIPYFEYEEHIYLKNGIVSKKGSGLYEKLYGDLIGMGNDDNKKMKDDLFDFLGSVHEWTYLSYISECFLPPGQVKDINTKDKQFVFLNKIINDKIIDKEPINVLDYGCGEIARIGRILTAHYKDKNQEGELIRKIHYYAYDKYIKNEYKEKLTNSDKIPCLREIINDEDKLKEKTFDIILLFNVLHEIDIICWEKELNKLLDALQDDGFIVFCEKRILSKGEKPYGKSGYLVLSDNELKKLFGSTADVEIEQSEADNILVAAVIKKNKKMGVQKITSENIEEALIELTENTSKKIFSSLDGNNEDKLSPRNYAFYHQQYYNAQHALKLLKAKNELPPDFEKWNYARIMSEKDENKKYRFLNKRANNYNDDIAKDCQAEYNNWI
ncbi:MAG: AAA family ATPase [Treponema sp.]|jgi:energy-coupling factor transporter ATP-binding protein EcfA2|nr:AAA family ATPase [Treponema sp.]